MSSRQQVIHGFLCSPESLTLLVEGSYQVYVQRLGDPNGLNGWLAKLQQGLPFASISEQILSSDEFYNAAAAHG